MTGVYRIRRKESDDCYVGSAQNVAHRWNRHRSDLRRGISGCRHLQSAWHLYGESSFEFCILELCPVNILLEREQWYLDNTKPTYNIALVAGAPMRGRTHSEENKKRFAKRMTGNQYLLGHKHSASTKKKMSDSHRNYSPEALERMRAASVKFWAQVRNGERPSPRHNRNRG